MYVCDLFSVQSFAEVVLSLARCSAHPMLVTCLMTSCVKKRLNHRLKSNVRENRLVMMDTGLLDRGVR